MACQHCGIEDPTQYTEFEQNIGMVYARRHLRLEADLCRPCMGMYFRSYTLTTFFLGWWGIISFFMTPVILFKNIAEYFRCKSLPEPGLSATNIPLDTRRALNTPWVLMGKILYGVVAWGIVLTLLAQSQVRFMQAHFPGINARLHGGAITDKSDGEYAMMQIVKDINGLQMKFSSPKWASARAEILARENYLTDLVSENDALQRRWAVERIQHSSTGTACHQWILDEFGPALNDYAVSTQAFFTFAKANAELTPENIPALNTTIKQRSGAAQKLNLVFSQVGVHCPKQK